MARFEPKQIDISLINGGEKYEHGQGVQPISINAPIEAILDLYQITENNSVAIDLLRTDYEEFQKLFKVSIEDKFVMRETANGLNVIDGSTVKVEKIKGSTVVHENTLKHAHINSIKSTGKNLLNLLGERTYLFNKGAGDEKKFIITENEIRNVYTSASSMDCIKYNKVYPAGTYVLTCGYVSNDLGDYYYNTHIAYVIHCNSIPIAQGIEQYNNYYSGYPVSVKIGNPLVLTTSEDFTLSIAFRTGANNVGNTMVYKNIQMSLGGTNTAFEPYKEDIWQLPETFELGEWDELNPQTGEVKKATTYTLVCNGAENWTDGQLGRPNCFNLGFTLNSLPLPLMKEYSKFLSSYYKEQVDLNCNVFGFYTSSEIYNKFNGDVEAWKAHLAELYAANNPLVIEYVSGEPTIKKIEGCPKNYTAFKNGTETVIKGEEDNSNAIPTITNEYFILR